MAVVIRRRSAPAPALSRREQEIALHRRAVRWLRTTAVTWPVWALTGAPTGLPHVTASTSHHVVASFGIWPAYLMLGGLADVARRARRIYAEPLVGLPEHDEDVDDAASVDRRDARERHAGGQDQTLAR